MCRATATLFPRAPPSRANQDGYMSLFPVGKLLIDSSRMLPCTGNWSTVPVPFCSDFSGIAGIDEIPYSKSVVGEGACSYFPFKPAPCFVGLPEAKPTLLTM